MEPSTSDRSRLSSAASRLHNGQAFELPDLDSPLVVVKEAIYDGERVVAIGIARLELNVTLLLDHEWATPIARLDAVAQLQEKMRAKAAELGIDWAHAEVLERFGKRLEELGWKPAKGKLYFLRIE